MGAAPHSCSAESPPRYIKSSQCFLPGTTSDPRDLASVTHSLACALWARSSRRTIQPRVTSPSPSHVVLLPCLMLSPLPCFPSSVPSFFHSSSSLLRFFPFNTSIHWSPPSLKKPESAWVLPPPSPFSRLPACAVSYSCLQLPIASSILHPFQSSFCPLRHRVCSHQSQTASSGPALCPHLPHARGCL